MGFKRVISCIGAGYVGGTTMSVIADKCRGSKIIVADIDEDKVKKWNSDELPIYEPGLLEIVKRRRGKNLFFTTNIESAIKEAEIVFVSVNTPTKTYGYGAGMAADLQYWEKTAREIVKYSDSPKVIVEKSTLPVRTAESMKKILNFNEKGIKFEVVSNPEFLAEGTAVKDLLYPDRVLIGFDQTDSGREAGEKVASIYREWVPEDKIIMTNIWSSELSKLVANAFLAQRISSINSITEFCELTGADVEEISYAVGMDSRIGNKFLKPSVGFGGSCFRKDILNLVYLLRYYNLSEAADYWEMVVKINEHQKERFVKNIVHSLFNTVVDKKIALFGFAFKANTGDTRESSAIFVAKRLLEEKAILAITDPKALPNAKKDLEGIDERVVYTDDPYEASSEAHAIAVLTEWEEFRKLDYVRIFNSMVKPAFIFDGRNILEHERLYEIGFNVFPIGKPPLTHI